MAEQTVIGKVGLTPKGEYNPETVYEILDVVSNTGNSYVSRIIENNQPLSDTEAWMLCAEKGIKGDQGDTFTFDDLTTAQKEELKGDVIAYNSLTEADKNDLAGRVPIVGVIEEGNTQAVSGGDVYKKSLTKAKFPNVADLESKFTLGKNKFNPEKVTEGGYFNTSGAWTTYANSSASDFIDVGTNSEGTISGLTYNISTGLVVVFFNSSKVKIGQVTGVSALTHTYPTNTKYIRFNSRFNQPSVNYNTIQYEFGAVATSYEPYASSLNPDILDEIKEDNVSFIESPTNLFDKDNHVVYDKLLNNGNGSETTANGWAYLKVPVSDEGGNIIFEKGLANVSDADDVIHFFNSSNVRIGYSTNASAPIPAGTTEVRTNISNSASNWLVARNSFVIQYGTSIVKSNQTTYKLNRYLMSSKLDELKGKIITWVGDSIIKAQGYVGLQSLFDENIGTASINKGDNGATITNIYPQASCISGSLLTYLFNDKTDIVIFSAGTNDFFRGLPIGTIQDGIDGIDTTVKGSLYKAIKWVKDNHPTVKIVVMTPIERSTNVQNTIGLYLIDYRNAIADVANHFGVKLIDNYHNNLVNKNNSYKYLYDGLHPNNFGYVEMYKVILNEFKNHNVG